MTSTSEQFESVTPAQPPAAHAVQPAVDAPVQPHAFAQPAYGAPMTAVDQRVAMAEMAAISQQKNVGLAYVLLLLLGPLGVHKFYLGRVGIGIAYLLTFGFLTIGLFVDLFTLPKQVRDANMLSRAQVRTQMGV